MIEQLLTSYVFDKLNKQIIKKIPYALLFALIADFGLDTQSLNIIVATLSFGCFLVSSFAFNYHASKISENIWKEMDVKAIVGKVSSIFESGSSWIKDIGSARTGIIITSGFLSGISFTITLSSVFLLLLNLLPLSSTMLLAFVIITSIYIIQDAVSGNLLDEPEKENKSPLLYDVMDTYLLKNSFESMKLKTNASRIALSFFAPIIGPLVYFTFPKVAFKELIVLYNEELREILRKYHQENEEIWLKHEDGRVLEDLFVFENNIENINIFGTRGPKDILPYIFDPKYVYPPEDKNQDVKVWAAFGIIQKIQGKEELMGHIFIHSFKGFELTVKKQPHTSDFDGKPKRKDILLIFIIGQRSIVNYLETKINLISAKAPIDRLI